MNPLPLFLIIVSLPLLLGGCEKFTVEPVAVQKAIEGVNAEEVEEREDIVYLKGSDTPYTGKVFALHPNGQKAEEANIKDGKPDGLAVGWYEDGQKKGEGNWKDGKKDGLFVEWHENGQKKLEGNYKDNKGIKGSSKFWNNKGEPVDSYKEVYK